MHWQLWLASGLWYSCFPQERKTFDIEIFVTLKPKDFVRKRNLASSHIFLILLIFKSAKNRFQLSAGLNRETLNTILSGTNHI